MQPDLWAHVRRDDPITSRQAFESVDLNRRCRECLSALYRRQSLFSFSDSDLAHFVGTDRNIAARRRKDLCDLGLVEPVYRDGEQETVMGRRGRQELLWVLSDRGRELAKNLERHVA